MKAEIPNFKTGFWNDPDRWNLLVYYVRWFITENMIWIMLVVGMFVAVGVVTIIADMFTKRSKNEEEDEVEYM